MELGEADARYAEDGMKVAVLDVDVHPGNGNEDTWWNDDFVLHVNLNESGIWPGPGHGDPKAVGGEDAIGTNLNFPIPVSIRHVVVFVFIGMSLYRALRGCSYGSHVARETS